MADSKIEKQLIVKALNRLGDLLGQNKRKYTLTCAGGIVSLLYFQSRSNTADVDVMFPEPWEGSLKPLKQSIEQVSKELKLPKRWMNDSIKFFGLETRGDTVIFKHPNLTLVAAKWEELLAHKVKAYRDERDYRDALLIMREIGATDKETLWDDVVKYAPTIPRISKEELRRRFDKIWIGAGMLEERLQARYK